MIRAKWKGSFVGRREYVRKNGNIWCRGLTVLEKDVGSVVNIYNGRTFLRIFITDAMVGHKYGALCMTRKVSKNIHLYKRKKKRNKK
jgi:small subunit ribosomal protein S19